MSVFSLFVVFLDGAQGAVEEPGLPEFALGAPVLVDRVLSRGEAAPRPYFMASEIATGYTGAQMPCPAAADPVPLQYAHHTGANFRIRVKMALAQVLIPFPAGVCRYVKPAPDRRTNSHGCD